MSLHHCACQLLHCLQCLTLGADQRAEIVSRHHDLDRLVIDRPDDDRRIHAERRAQSVDEVLGGFALLGERYLVDRLPLAHLCSLPSFISLFGPRGTPALFAASRGTGASRAPASIATTLAFGCRFGALAALARLGLTSGTTTVAAPAALPPLDLWPWSRRQHARPNAGL